VAVSIAAEIVAIRAGRLGKDATLRPSAPAAQTASP
jgi:xanthine/CO dehydrogenase XdhC/CoxF family maturation factor